VNAYLPISGRSRIAVKATATRANGTEEDTQRPADDAEALVKLAERNTKVADALRFLNMGGWSNLYKAWEIVSDAAGDYRAVVRNGWAAKRDQSRFTGTAQSRRALGDEARHASAKKKYEGPQNPMTLKEAQDFVRSTIRAWIGTLWCSPDPW